VSCLVALFPVCLTIGAYSKWLDSASCGLSVLPSVLDILMNGMGTSEDCAAAAALAFRHICDGIVNYSYSIFVHFLFYLWNGEELAGLVTVMFSADMEKIRQSTFTDNK